jgi:PASTA domain
MACAAVAGSMLVLAEFTGASTTHDLRGIWSCCGSGGAGLQTWKITTMNPASGKFSGSGGGGSITFPITGTASGSSVTLTTGPYTQLPSYTATFTGKVSSTGKTMTGAWKSNQRQSGTWTATQTSAPKTSVCTVPKLAGDTEGTAKSALHKAKCGVGKVSVKQSAKVAKGRVISSSPAAGVVRKAGAAVAITVSSGLPQCKVPKLAGDKEAAAKVALGKAKCSVGKVSVKRSAKVAKGRVISSSPAAGSVHKAGTRVNLAVSRGKH